MTHQHIAYFEPSSLKTLGQAYQTCKTVAQRHASSDAVCELIADRIMCQASRGETDAQRLIINALRGISPVHLEEHGTTNRPLFIGERYDK